MPGVALPQHFAVPLPLQSPLNNAAKAAAPACVSPSFVSVRPVTHISYLKTKICYSSIRLYAVFSMHPSPNARSLPSAPLCSFAHSPSSAPSRKPMGSRRTPVPIHLQRQQAAHCQIKIPSQHYQAKPLPIRGIIGKHSY